MLKTAWGTCEIRHEAVTPGTSMSPVLWGTGLILVYALVVPLTN